MKLRILWFGRPAASPYESEVESYRRRVSRRWPAEDVPLRATAGGRDADPLRVLRAEAARVADRLPETWPTVVLDASGDTASSVEFAEIMRRFEDQGKRGVAFVVGSDLGLDEQLKKRAARRLSLGPMTLPHLLARLLLWEQLYRATSILGGGRYHRHDVQ